MNRKKDRIMCEIQKIISAQGLWTYKYTRNVIKFVTSFDDDRKFIVILQQFLEDVTKNGSKTEIDSEEIFTVYYALAHYYRLYDKKDKLVKLIEQYSGCFINIPFNNEVICWYYKRKGDWENAYRYSKELLNEFAVSDNAGIYANFISTVISMLEEEYRTRNSASPKCYWRSEDDRVKDWEFCYNKSKEIIDNDPYTIGERVGAQYAKMGKLLVYMPGLENKTIDIISNIANEANEYFNNAIIYQDEQGSNYNKRCMEFRQMQVQCYIHALEIINSKNNKSIEDKLEDLVATEKELKENMEHQLARSLEIISIFTAVITLIITSVGIFNGICFNDAVYLLLITTCSWCLVYSVFVFMIHSGKRMLKSIIISLIMVALLCILTRNFVK